jgi:hypothetical protein
MLIVEIEFNGQPFGDAFVLTDAAGEFYVEAFWLERWEVVTPLPQPRQHAGNDYYRIGAFDGAWTTTGISAVGPAPAGRRSLAC